MGYTGTRGREVLTPTSDMLMRHAHTLGISGRQPAPGASCSGVCLCDKSIGSCEIFNSCGGCLSALTDRVPCPARAVCANATYRTPDAH